MSLGQKLSRSWVHLHILSSSITNWRGDSKQPCLGPGPLEHGAKNVKHLNGLQKQAIREYICKKKTKNPPKKTNPRGVCYDTFCLQTSQCKCCGYLKVSGSAAPPANSTTSARNPKLLSLVGCSMFLRHRPTGCHEDDVEKEKNMKRYREGREKRKGRRWETSCKCRRPRQMNGINTENRVPIHSSFLVCFHFRCVDVKKIRGWEEEDEEKEDERGTERRCACKSKRLWITILSLPLDSLLPRCVSI